MRKNLYAVIGRSGSGKDTIVDILCSKYGFSRVKSYTTRPKRHDEIETTHIFVTDQEMDAIMNDEVIVASCIFNGYRYCATAKQVSNSDIYIVDMAGFQKLKSTILDREIYVIGITANTCTCQQRMCMRGDNFCDIRDRITHDDIAFKGLSSVADILINNKDVDNTIIEVMKFIESKERG